MEGLIKEAKSPVRYAGIISADQKMEHYEIATYRTLVAFATTLGEDNAATL
jgi:ferritin-like metal-binding protein YciE